MSAGTAAVKTGIGVAQSIKGKKLGKGLVRPTKEISSGMKAYLENAKAIATSSRLPGQTAIEQKIGASTAHGIRGLKEGASSAAGLTAGIAGLRGKEQEVLAGVGIAGAKIQDTNKQRLQEALLKYGKSEDELFQINEMTPFEEQAEAAESLTGAGLQNIVGGLEQGAGTAAFAGGLRGGNNTQKFLSARRRGFTGTYNDWLGKQSLNTGLNLNIQ